MQLSISALFALMELSEVMEVFSISTIQYGNYWPHIFWNVASVTKGVNFYF